MKKTVCGVAVALSLFCGVGYGQDDCAQCPRELKHIVAGHEFLPSYLLPTPFSHSSAVLLSGVAYTTIPNDVVQELKLAAFSPKVEAQIGFGKSFALSLGATGVIVAGLNTPSAVTYGASTGYQWRAGLLYELLRAKRDVFSLGLEINRPHVYSVSPLVALRELRDILSGSVPDFVSDRTATIWRPGLRYARAFSPTFGLQAYAAMRFSTIKEERGEEEEVSTEPTHLIGGALLDVGLKHKLGVPIGLTFTYLRNQNISEGGRDISTWNLGIYETFSRTFNAGFEIGRSLADRDSTLIALTLRTYYD